MKAELPEIYKRRKTCSLLLRLNPGTLVQALLILFFPCFLAAQSQHVILVSCENKTPIDGAYVLDENNGKVLGYSNQDGRVYFSKERLIWPHNVKIYKMSALDTTILLKRGEVSICLNPRAYKLSTFEVISEKEDIAESFRRFMDKTISVLKHSDTTHFYSFTWECTVLDSNWKLMAEGVMKLPFKSFEKANSGALGGKFCQVKFNVDSAFYQSEFLEEYNLNHIPFYFINSDFLRKRFPYRKTIKDEMILKKIVSDDSTSFVYSTTLKKNWKQYVGYPLFNQDSIMVRNVSEYLLIDTLGKQKGDFIFLSEKDIHGYKLIEDELILSEMKMENKIRHVSGAILNESLRVNLLTDSIPCQEIHLIKSFKKEDLDEISEFENYQVIVQ